MESTTAVTPDRASSSITRRQMLAGLGTATSLVYLASCAKPGSPLLDSRPRFTNYPFTLGVASGDPDHESVVLWTRLAPDPLNGGGMPDANVAVTWRIARDEQFRDAVRSGHTVAEPGWGHSVHAVASGLAPDTWYFYRFEVGDEVSPVGRTRTLPRPGAAVDELRFATVSCQNYTQGYFAPYKFIAEDDLDFVTHVGDYIYETGVGELGTNTLILPFEVVRRHNTPPTITLEDYRNRYALYKSDANLMAAHAACPWFVTWDDHEVEDDWAGDEPGPDNDMGRPDFLRRRAAGAQAYYEHMPIRTRPGTPLYRSFAFGDLAGFWILDTRMYRTPQPCDYTFPSTAACPEMDLPDATMTGSRQQDWLLTGLETSAARWNAMAQQTVFAPYDYGAGGQHRFNMDQWDGYRAQRSRLLAFLAEAAPSNPIILSGDWHSCFANDIKADFSDPASGTVATEYVGSSVSSACPWRELVSAHLDQNPHVRYFNGDHRGYVLTTVTPQTWEVSFRAVSDPLEPDTDKVSIEALQTFVTEDGKPGVQRL